MVSSLADPRRPAQWRLMNMLTTRAGHHWRQVQNIRAVCGADNDDLLSLDALRFIEGDDGSEIRWRLQGHPDFDRLFVYRTEAGLSWVRTNPQFRLLAAVADAGRGWQKLPTMLAEADVDTAPVALLVERNFAQVDDGDREIPPAEIISRGVVEEWRIRATPTGRWIFQP